MKILDSAARALEISLAAHSPALGEVGSANRRNDVRAMSAGPNRAAAIALDIFAAKQHRLAEFTLSSLAKIIGGVRYVGNGAQASVYRTNDTVTKVYRNTILMGDAERRVYQAEHQSLTDTLSSNLGSMVTRQQFSIGEHPLGMYSAVLGSQPYVAGKRLDIFELSSLNIRRAELTKYCETHSIGRQQLYKLVDATFQIDDAFNLVPDLNGADNFRVAQAGELYLIDAEPIDGTQHPQVRDLVLAQADALSVFLNAA